MKRYNLPLGAALGFSAMPLLLACNEPTGLEQKDPTVRERPMTVAISPSITTLQVGETRRLRAILRDGGGEVLDSHYPVAWSSSRPDRVHISESGFVTGIGLGSAVIRAEGHLGLDETRVTVVNRPADTPPGPSGEKWEPEDDEDGEGGNKEN